MSATFGRREFVAGVTATALMPRASSAFAQQSDPGIYFDQNGLIVQRDGDGGDTAQREGFVWFALKLRDMIGTPKWDKTLPIGLGPTLDLLEVGRTGEFRRHPTQGSWKSDPDGFSRDQLTPLVATMGMYGDVDRLRRSWNAMRPCYAAGIKCVQGTKDLAPFALLNLYHRGFGERPTQEGDAHLLFGIGNRLAQAQRNPEDTSDDLNTVVHLLMAKVRSPSVITDQAATLYAKNRAVSAGCYLGHYRQAYPGDFTADESTQLARIKQGIERGWTTDCPRVLGALRWYFRAESGGCSSLAELYQPLIEKWLT